METEKTTRTTTTSQLRPITQIAVMLISALSFIAAFAWNGTVEAFMTQKYGTKRDFRVYLIYAVIITVIAGILIYFIARYTDVFLSKEEEEIISIVGEERRY
jgi:hypothetical protein